MSFDSFWQICYLTDLLSDRSVFLKDRSFKRFAFWRICFLKDLSFRRSASRQICRFDRFAFCQIHLLIVLPFDLLTSFQFHCSTNLFVKKINPILQPCLKLKIFFFYFFTFFVIIFAAKLNSMKLKANRISSVFDITLSVYMKTCLISLNI